MKELTPGSAACWRRAARWGVFPQRGDLIACFDPRRFARDCAPGRRAAPALAPTGLVPWLLLEPSDRILGRRHAADGPEHAEDPGRERAAADALGERDERDEETDDGDGQRREDDSERMRGNPTKPSLLTAMRAAASAASAPSDQDHSLPAEPLAPALASLSDGRLASGFASPMSGIPLSMDSSSPAPPDRSRRQMPTSPREFFMRRLNSTQAGHDACPERARRPGDDRSCASTGRASSGLPQRRGDGSSSPSARIRSATRSPNCSASRSGGFPTAIF